MAELETRVRVIWGEVGPDTPLVSGDDGTDTFVVAGDMTRNFLEGTAFLISGTPSNNGSYFCDQDATYDGTNTTIYADSPLGAAQGAVGTITEPAQFIEFSFGVTLQAIPSEPAVVVKDRIDREIIIRPVTDTERKFNKVSVIPHSTDCLIRSNAGEALPDMLYAYAMLSNTLFQVYHYEVNHQDSTPVTTRRCYKGYLYGASFASFLGTISHTGQTPGGSLDFQCIDDGTFTFLGNGDTNSYRWGA